MGIRKFTVCMIVLGLWTVPVRSSDEANKKGPLSTVVYESGEEGYHTYRIPALVVTSKGTLLAFCEGRKTSSSDHGDIDLILRRSSDEDKTWPTAKILEKGPGAYSDLAVLPDGRVCCLFEDDGYKRIVFSRFSLRWLTDKSN